jgi:pimeloyl-ACP methyl ester carboxylesterase
LSEGLSTHTAPGSAAFDETRFSASDGLTLSARIYGDRSAEARRALPVICLPGLTRNGSDFHQIALRLSRASTPRRVIALDYRGRGRSEWDRNKQNYNLAVETGDVLAALDALDVEHAVFIGTSRGALIIHLLAGARPACLRAAILNDAGPVIEGAGLAQIKNYLERTPTPKDWNHAAELLRETHGASFPVLTERDWADMAEAIYIERKGRLVGDYDPALVAQLAGIDFNTPLPTLWQQFEGLKPIPLMVIRGEHSALLTGRTVSEMAARHPELVMEVAPGQGHAPLLHIGPLPERIEAFVGHIA